MVLHQLHGVFLTETCNMFYQYSAKDNRNANYSVKQSLIICNVISSSLVIMLSVFRISMCIAGVYGPPIPAKGALLKPPGQ